MRGPASSLPVLGLRGSADDAHRSTFSAASAEGEDSLEGDGRPIRSRTGQRWYFSQIASRIVAGDGADMGATGSSTSFGSPCRKGPADADGSLSPRALTLPGRLDRSERDILRRSSSGLRQNGRRSPQRRVTQKARADGAGSPTADGAGEQVREAAAELAEAEKDVMSLEVMKEKFSAVDQMIEQITRGMKLDGVSKRMGPDEERAQRQKEIEARRLSLKMHIEERGEARNPHRIVAQKIESRREHKFGGPGIPLMRISVAGPAGAKKVAVVDVDMLRSRVKQPSGTNVRGLLELQRLRDARERSDRARRRSGGSLAAAAKAALQPTELALAVASVPEG